jgi:hypothetical protein
VRNPQNSLIRRCKSKRREKIEFYDLMERHGDPWEKIDILPQLAVHIKPRPDDWMWYIHTSNL